MGRNRERERRLPIRRETIRQLDARLLTPEDLARVAGGDLEGDCKSCKCTEY